MTSGLLSAAMITPGATAQTANGAAVFEEFCLRGELDLGARLQGRRPSPGEFHATEWCVISSSADERVRFAAAGRSNPDAHGAFVLSYLSPDRVRIVNADSPPDIEFRGALAHDELLAVRRTDPRRLLEELEQHPEWVISHDELGVLTVRWPGADATAEVLIQEGRLQTVRTEVDLPLRGRVPVEWNWSSPTGTGAGDVELTVDGQLLFRAKAERRILSEPEATALWQPSGEDPPREVPGKAWPSIVQMRIETLSPGVHIVRGVRTGFNHLVVETAEGLVVADAPAGWVEFHQLPPTDLVPGLGVSGLSERFIDFLGRQWPGAPVRAVVLTHAHDDHAGGGRAFAAAGAEVYAAADVAGFIESALNRSTMPTDRLSMAGRRARVRPVAQRLVLADSDRSVELLSLGANPHVDAALGIYVPGAGVFFQSDLSVPRNEAPEPPDDRVQMECWFARWATERLPLGTTVHSSHGSIALTVDHLATYVAHPACSDGR